LTVDLFEPSTGPKHGVAAERLDREEALGLTAIGRRLKITKRAAEIAVQYGRLMREAGLADAFIELTQRPSSGSRWRERGARYRASRCGSSPAAQPPDRIKTLGGGSLSCSIENPHPS
jgi:hypothetical protein